jgi:BirA family biotin operon repressor/biotin-[acetyl-CoA-carboxylase] ligase
MTVIPPIQFSAKVSSTNDLALKGADEGAPHGSCWAADEQTAGRGRREIGGERREWFSPKHSNIHMSVLLRPNVEPSRAAGLTLAAAAGICSTLRFITGLDIWVKWPNDLYIGDKKLAGLLTEAATEDGELAGVVVGLGLNVNVSEGAVPTELSAVMTSLQIAGDRYWDRLQLLPAIRGSILEYADRYVARGYAGIIDDLRDFDRTEGRDVQILVDGEWVDGTARGISDDGQLRVETANRVHLLQAGEVRF